MGMIAKCNKCKKTYRYDSGEIMNLGTFWQPIWTVKCHHCGALIQHKEKPMKAFENAQLGTSSEGVKIKIAPPKPNGHERATKGDIREYWAQKYFKSKYKMYGFSRIEGPFDSGPDFIGVYKGRRTGIEIERTCGSYIKHKHHNDSRFRNVRVLVVLSSQEPTRKSKSKLPRSIIHIDIKDFVKWWRPKAKKYARAKQLQGRILLIANEFQKRFFYACDDKDRSMATCPECNLCPYFLTERGVKSTVFTDMAMHFFWQYKYDIASENFKITDIKSIEINNFYVTNVLTFFHL